MEPIRADINLSRSLPRHDLRLFGLKDPRSDRGLLAFKEGIMMTFRQTWGIFPVVREKLTTSLSQPRLAHWLRLKKPYRMQSSVENWSKKWNFNHNSSKSKSTFVNMSGNKNLSENAELDWKPSIKIGENLTLNFSVWPLKITVVQATRRGNCEKIRK